MSRSAPVDFIEFAALLDADGFSRRNCDMIDMVMVPDRLEDPVTEAQCHDVLDGFLAEEMVDPVDLLFVENCANLALSALADPGHGRTAFR